ncbi:enoyl-CoA hydratase-related protein [Puniceibacterium confluentis]|uniref:enoyl-CoA hydratase-related protein n=1 Tax=Puniceibacterium confluentis TaxID=1958944 RepID=UPI0011B47F7B|nr:enoyl-CoA hydratase-related protein [Puniceibacterium confluentis]
MSESVIYTVRDGVAFLAVSNPPVNALSHAVRKALRAALDRAAAETGVQEIVLIGQGRSFPAGADINEFDTKPGDPSIAELCACVEASEKPVVAAIHGTALGGGFELALAAHYRVAHAAARVGLPEVRLGLLPGAGGTQRVPRILGAKLALDMLLSGQAYPVSAAPGQLFVDVQTEGDLTQAAYDVCHRLRREGIGPRRSRDIRKGLADPLAYQAEVTLRRSQADAQPEQARREIVDAVEAALLLPFDAGLAFEQDCFERLVASDQSKALRHRFFAERRAGKFRYLQDAKPPEIGSIAVLGGGPLAVQLVVSGLQAGLTVCWGTRDPAPLRDGVAQVHKALRQSVSRGALSQVRADDCLARLRQGGSAEMAAEADMILHAARGQGDVPAPPETVRAVVMPGRVDQLGLRFARPLGGTRLVEVVQGPEATPQQVAAGLGLARRLGKVPVQVRSSGASVLDRLWATYHRAADALVDIGHSPYAVDAALRSWGWAQVPFEMRDAVGLGALAAQPRAGGGVNWSAVMMDMGRGGREVLAGFYAYPDMATTPVHDRQVIDLINEKRGATAVPDPDGIADLMVAALANEGARMMAEGMVSRPGDVDVVAMLGQGFPRWRGGPMKAAGLFGLARLRRMLRDVEHPDTDFWTPQPVFDQLIKNGQDFDALDRA